MKLDIRTCTDFVCKHRLKLIVLPFVLLIGWPASVLINNEIQRSSLDPKIPYQIYKPPPAPNYASPQSWYLNPALAHYYADPRKVDVFFIHATAYDGGTEWLSPLQNQKATEHVTNVQLPNYAGPFSLVGNVYAPKYRSASLYAHLTMREDAKEARKNAYNDIEKAFDIFLKTRHGGRGFIIVGLEQGGFLAERLVRDKVSKASDLKAQLIAAYLIETMLPRSALKDMAMPACQTPDQYGCVVAFISIESNSIDKVLDERHRSLFWKVNSEVDAVGSEPVVCVNPLSGVENDTEISLHFAKGATNATGLEWGAEPAQMGRKVSARCFGGSLFVTKADLPSFKTYGSWADRRKVKNYNLFYGDLQDDSHRRLVAYTANHTP
jgi:hypothetical protein